MKRIFLLFFVCLAALQGVAQKNEAFTEEDVRHFYMTLQGDYHTLPDDSTSFSLHLTPIWEREENPYRWLYLEAVDDKTQQVVEQKIIEVVPQSSITFKVLVHNIKHPEVFAGKWSNRDFFNGYNTGILKGGKKFIFFKTKDYEYQTNWYRRKSFKCFPSGDRIHFKFVQQDERFYVKRLLNKSSRIIGFSFIKDPTD